MKKLHFTNYWYGKMPAHYRLIITLIFFIPLSYDFFFGKETIIFPAHVQNFVWIVFLLTALLAILYSLWQSTRKNAFIYQGDSSFGLRIDSNKTEFKVNDISEISWNKESILQIRRFNRVDTFDVSDFRIQDQEKMMRHIYDLLSNEVAIRNTPINA